MPIPKIIHYCWYGHQPLTPLAEACIESWKKHHPTWEIKRWDETNTPIESSPYMVKAYKMKKWAFVSDYARFFALKQEGGIYLDTDIEVIKPLDPFLENSIFFAGSEHRLTVYPGTAIMGCPINDVLPKAVLVMLDDQVRIHGKKPTLNPSLVFGFIMSNPQLAHRIYPSEIFYPYNPFEHEQPIKQLMYRDIKPETCAIHHWAYSWYKKPNRFQKIYAKIIRKIKK